MSTPSAAVPDTDIVIKLIINNTNRRFKLPLQDLTASVLPHKVRSILKLSEGQKLHLERFSDTSASYVTLDTTVPSTYKTLYRAAKAKRKLRLRAAILGSVMSMDSSVQPPVAQTQQAQQVQPAILDLADPAPSVQPSSTSTREQRQPAQTSERSAAPRGNFVQYLETITSDRELGRRMQEAQPPLMSGVWQVWCNNCNDSMPNVHFHCSICDMGDYDLCEKCVDAGVLCPGEGHWLIKRFLRNGQPVNSSTERIAPKPRSSAPVSASDMPGSFNSESRATAQMPIEPKRTCNRCVRVLPERMLVTCADCDDYDLCLPCAVGQKHGHHPAHSFQAITPEVQLVGSAAAVCAPGRNLRHLAVCDGCDKTIRGVRHKCLDCPDWDFCSECYKGAGESHKGHRFVDAFESIALSASAKPRHFGVYCDGPLCKGALRQCHISGVRFKCAICDDTDFCANCEAHPSNSHNPSHPLIKFKTPVDHVSITTFGQTPAGSAMPPMGDSEPLRLASHNASTATLPAYSPAAPPAPMMGASNDELPVRDAAAAVQPSVTQSTQTRPAAERVAPRSLPLDGHFQKDSIPDGTTFEPGAKFTQVWTITNPGPATWPAGCRVRFVGGDFMFDAVQDRPMSVAALSAAQESAAILQPVAPGQSHDFAVNLCAPEREGKHISYWRMKNPDGVHFGHKLWVDVLVKKAGSSLSYRSAEKSTHRDIALREYETQLKLLDLYSKAKLARAAEKLQANRDLAQKSPHASPQLAAAQRAMQNQTQREQEERVQPPMELEQPQVEEHADAEDMEGSSMVFPKLEKESPSSSTYQDAPPAPPSTTATEYRFVHSTPQTVIDVETATERDLESVDFDSSDDESFLTDEEYDILDASDEDLPRARA